MIGLAIVACGLMVGNQERMQGCPAVADGYVLNELSSVLHYFTWSSPSHWDAVDRYFVHSIIFKKAYIGCSSLFVHTSVCEAQFVMSSTALTTKLKYVHES